ncbi:stimulus-sensing domain-containing protein [Paremcibacter congregatus]|uniref:stimulus-sensing domain-containing protein n=1 Tax=Paremcibacter congregatus TaxID=2043170 RepID=UPI003A8FEB7D
MVETASSAAENDVRNVKLLRNPRRMSPLTFRILMVNLIALGFLAGGILYIDQYQTTMVQSRISSMIKDAEVMAGALGEAATVTNEETELRLEPARQIMVRIVGVTNTRTRLFGLDGRRLLDSRDLEIGQSVVIDELPLNEGWSAFWDGVSNRISQLLDNLHRRDDLEQYHEVKGEVADHYPEVVSALEGQIGYRMRHLSDQAEVITVAVPVQRFRRVLGALMLSADTRDIIESVQQTRLTFLKFFGVVLLVTLLLSFFLARTIVRPILRLARSADRISAGTHTGADIPDYSGRNDEVGDLSRSLKDMTLTLARQIDAVANFAADVSHELKNPLTSLRSAVETFSYAKDDAAKEKLLGIIAHDVERLDRLITDIANVSRLDAEMSRSQMKPVNLSHLLTTIIDLYDSSQSDQIPDLHLEVASPKGGDKTDRAYEVSGLEGQLGQVFRNLIDNAISFSKPDGHIWVRLSHQRNMVQLVVEDEGRGIPEDKLEDIFERFYSERPKAEAFGRHSGLGLSICKQIVEAHGGAIIAENRRKVKGARFIVQLRPWAQGNGASERGS